MFGILLIDKPQGLTSHDVVYRVRRALGTKKVGHAGTLDPLATGLLVVAVGPATRFLRYLQLEPKEYVFTVAFGRETTTYDAEGETVADNPVPVDLESKVRDSLVHFVGEIEQLPPMYSAVKKDGKPLYAYARKGETVERESRTVTVFSLELVRAIGPTELEIRCVCSGGTYVRTLAHDLGQRVGCGAHVAALTRTKVGRFSIEDAIAPDEANEGHLLPLAEALEPMPVVRLTEGQLFNVMHGAFLRVQNAPNETLAALTDPDGTLVSVARVVENELHPECVVPSEALHGAV
jgi:tRNA pseudouridine55 synthase